MDSFEERLKGLDILEGGLGELLSSSQYSCFDPSVSPWTSPSPSEEELQDVARARSPTPAPRPKAGLLLRNLN